jgi:hypothetical protein
MMPVQPQGSPLEVRLERGEVVHFPVCPFPMPEGDDRDFLNSQRLAHRGHKNISYSPATGKVKGAAAASERLDEILAAFSRQATAWLATALPGYAKAWKLDQVSFRPAEEATRKLRQKARNDLLHVDAFPSRPTNGERILRLFVNTNRTEPRVWITAAPFAELLARHGKTVGLPGEVRPGVIELVKEHVGRLFKPGRRRRSDYDRFMLRFHDYLKASQEVQTGPRRTWSFEPGCSWLALR